MPQARRPTFKRKHDVLIHGQVPREELAIDHAIAPFDRLATEMDRTWGVGMLASYVPAEMAAKYGRTLASLNEAISAVDIDRAVDRASACMRGLNAMDAEARKTHTPPDPRVVVIEMDNGDRFGILVDDLLWKKAGEQHPGITLHTLREIGMLLQAARGENPILAAVKDAFPSEAEIVEFKRPTGPMPDDDIPF